MKSFNRVVVIAPTRSTCLNISIALQNSDIPPTLLMQEKGEEIFAAVGHLDKSGFGVVAGTGTGKTVAIRDIAHRVLSAELRVDIITREHDTTEYTWSCNVLVVTPGVALHWLKSGTIGSSDLIVIDEIHQTSEHLELSMALAKRAGCTFVWMSATIDPTTYAHYLNAQQVITCSAFDPTRRAKVTCQYLSGERPTDTFLEKKVGDMIRERRGVAVFVPTRADAERLARHYAEVKGIHADFYHGGEKAEKLRAFLTGEVPKPFVVFMTTAGASSLNVLGLDMVVIKDEMYAERIHSGVKVLERVSLGNNELLQMGGRVNGRAENGEIVILTPREIDFHALEPNTPQFMLGGDLERVALTCARLGINASQLDLIGHINHERYTKCVQRFRDRKVIEPDADSLTTYGKKIEHFPVGPAWAELLVHAEESGNQELLNTIVVCSCIESLYGLIRPKEATLRNWVVEDSDHLTAYNIVTEALRQFGYIRKDGEAEYQFRGDYVRKSFDPVTRQAQSEKGEFVAWCDFNHLRAKSIKEVAIAMKSVYRQFHMRLPPTQDFAAISAGSSTYRDFLELIAKVQSLDFVRYKNNSQAGEVWRPQHSQVYSEQSLGTIRYWEDKWGTRRASMEGTGIPTELVHKFASQRITSLGNVSGGERITAYYTETFAGETFETSHSIPFDDVPVHLRRQAEAALKPWERAEQKRLEYAVARMPAELVLGRLRKLSSNVLFAQLSPELQTQVNQHVFLPYETERLRVWTTTAENVCKAVELALQKLERKEQERQKRDAERKAEEDRQKSQPVTLNGINLSGLFGGNFRS